METFRKLCFGGFLLASAASLLVLPQFAASPAKQMPAMDHAAQADRRGHTRFPRQASAGRAAADDGAFSLHGHSNLQRLCPRRPHQESSLPAALLLSLRPQPGPRQLARLLRQSPRHGLRCLPEGGFLCVPADAPGQEPGANPRGNHARGLAKGRHHEIREELLAGAARSGKLASSSSYPVMAHREHAPETPATSFLRQHGVAFTEFLYDYVDHGGTAESARQLGVDEHAVVKTLVMQDQDSRCHC